MILLQDFPFATGISTATGIVAYQALDSYEKDTSTIKKVEKVYKLEPISNSDVAYLCITFTLIFVGICILNAFTKN